MPAAAQRWAELLASSPISPPIKEQSDRPDNAICCCISWISLSSPSPTLPLLLLLLLIHSLPLSHMLSYFLLLSSFQESFTSSSHASQMFPPLNLSSLSSFLFFSFLCESLSVNSTKVSRNFTFKCWIKRVSRPPPKIKHVAVHVRFVDYFGLQAQDCCFLFVYFFNVIFWGPQTKFN